MTDNEAMEILKTETCAICKEMRCDTCEYAEALRLAFNALVTKSHRCADCAKFSDEETHSDCFECSHYYRDYWEKKS